MNAAIWTIVSDLHESSPFAKVAEQAVKSMQSEQSHQLVTTGGRKWNIPFHQKVCLWRLVIGLYAKGQVGVGIGAAWHRNELRPSVFNSFKPHLQQPSSIHRSLL